MAKESWKDGHTSYKGHRFDLRRHRTAGGEDQIPELLIDGRMIPLRRLIDGTYYIPANAYEWDTDVMKLAERFVDYQARVAEHRLPKEDEGDSGHGPA